MDEESKVNERIVWLLFINPVCMKSYYNYLFSEHRVIYQQLGRKYKLAPYRVYQLAHGNKARNLSERNVLHELMNLKVIKDVQWW